jgi:anti-anti-sigma regulatory factor
MESELFTAGDGALKLSRNPELTEINRVKAEMVRMLKEGAEGVRLDLTGVENITSTTVGMAVAVHLHAVEAGRTLTVAIREGQKRLFDLTMLTQTLSLEVANRPAG